MMSCSSSATPLQPPDSILRLHDTMKFLESRRCSKSTRYPCRNNLPLLQSWDLKEGIWVDSKIYSPNCHWEMWFSGSDQVNDAKCSGPAHNWAYMTSAPKPFWSCFFTSHVSVSPYFFLICHSLPSDHNDNWKLGMFRTWSFQALCMSTGSKQQPPRSFVKLPRIHSNKSDGPSAFGSTRLYSNVKEKPKLWKSFLNKKTNTELYNFLFQISSVSKAQTSSNYFHYIVNFQYLINLHQSPQYLHSLASCLVWPQSKEYIFTLLEAGDLNHI